MAFRFQCPKCNTVSFSIERDSRSYAPRGQPHELIFSCRCGKQMFGTQIDKEYDRQKAEYDANPHNDQAEEPPVEVSADGREDQLRKAYAHQAAYQAQKKKDAEAKAKAKKQEEDRRWRERVAQADQPATAAAAPKTKKSRAAPSPDAGEKMGSQGCGWHACDNPPRPNSKYCSRDCSNKNARARYKRRKAADRAA